MGDVPNRHTDTRPALPGHGRALSPALGEFVRLLAEVAIEKYLDEAGKGPEQHSPTPRADDGCSDQHEATSAQAGQSVQEGRSHG